MVHNQEPSKDAMESNIATTGHVTTASSDIDMTQEDMSDDVSFTSAEGILQNGHDMTSETDNDVMDTNNHVMENAVAKAIQVHSNSNNSSNHSDSPTLSAQLDGVTVVTNQPEQVTVS